MSTKIGTMLFVSLLIVGLVVEGKKHVLEYVAKDSAYVGTISVGTPPQSVNVAFDSNAGLLWVPNSECKCAAECASVPELVCHDICNSHCCVRNDDDGNDNGTIPEVTAYGGLCTRKHVFDPKASATFLDRKSCVNADFLNQTTAFNIALDTLHLGPSHKSEVSVTSFTLATADSLPEEYTDLKYDGVFGLARTGPKGLIPPVSQLARRRIIPQPLLTLAFGQTENPFGLYNAELSIGEIDTTRCDITVKNFVPTVSRDQWKQRAWQLYLNGSIHTTYMTAIDIASPYIHLPNDLFGIVQKESKYNEETDVRTMNCEVARRYLNRLQVNFGFGNFAFNPNLLVKADVEYEGRCEVMIKQSADNTMILGLPFLHQKCVVLDYNGRIAVATYRNAIY